MVSLAKGDSSCTLVNWFIAKFCMFFTGRHGQTKTSLDICQFFFSIPDKFYVKELFLFAMLSIWCCAVYSGFQVDQLRQFAINSKFCALLSVPGSRVWFPAISRFPGFRLKTICLQFHRIWSRGSRLAVLNIYSLSSGLIHLTNNSLLW